LQRARTEALSEGGDIEMPRRAIVVDAMAVFANQR
jgi:hypothetical protein